jgi:hypothetical protein
LGRISFIAKSKPAIGWSEIESCLQKISTPAGSSDLPVELSATLAHDPAFADEPPVITDPPITNHLPITSDLPAINAGDPLAMLSLLAAVPSNQS